MKIADTSSQDVTVVEKKPKQKRIIWTVAIAGMLSLTFWQVAPAASRWSQAEMSIPLKRVRLATINRADFIRDISVQGRVVAAVSPTVYSPAEGTISFKILQSIASFLL